MLEVGDFFWVLYKIICWFIVGMDVEVWVVVKSYMNKVVCDEINFLFIWFYVRIFIVIKFWLDFIFLIFLYFWVLMIVF